MSRPGFRIASAYAILCRAAASTWLARAVLALALFGLPLLYVGRQALRDPSIEFLPPSLRGSWMLHPVQEILNFQHGRVSKDVEFVRSYTVESVPTGIVLRLRAFTTPTVLHNGVEVHPDQPVGNWKRLVEYSLTPTTRTSTNELRIRVSNAEAIPALRVETPRALSDASEWQAALEPEFGVLQPVVDPLHRAPAPGPLQQWSGWRRARWLAFAWLALAAGSVLWVVVRRAMAPAPPPQPERQMPKWVEYGVPAALLAVAIWLNLANTTLYPHTRASFDWAGHVEYIQRVASTWRTPIAVEGWEMFQPPLYYFAAALVYRAFGGDASPEFALKRVQYFGCLTGLATVVLTWLYVRRLMPQRVGAQWAATLFAAFLPMSLYMNPLITNEVFSGTVIAGAVYVLLVWQSSDRVRDRTAVASGFATGVALLAGFTGLFSFVAGALAFGFRRLSRTRRAVWQSLALYMAVGLLVCGWFYARNLRIFDNAFIGNWDVASGFHYEQNPSYRTVGFYVGFGDVFVNHPERARWSTWLNGNYASMWSDPHTNFLRMENTHGYFWAGVTLILAALPTAAMALGFGSTLASAWRRPARNPDTLLAAVAVWTWGSLILFTMEIPTYSTVKAFFFLSLVPILGVFLARGRQTLARYAPVSRWALDGSLVALAAISVVIYRYQA